jgi:hypothetical protein
MAKKAQMDATRAVIDAGNEKLDTIEEFLDGLDKIADKGADVVESGLEKVADVVPETLDTTVHVSTKGGRKIVRFFRNPKNTAITLIVAGTVVGAGVGVAGYFLMRKRLEQKLRAEYDLELESEIAEMRRFYALRNKEGEFATPQGAVEQLLTKEAAQALSDYQGKGGEPQNLTVVEGPPVIHADPDPEPKLTLEERRKAMKAAGYTDAQINEVLGVEMVDIRALQDRMRSGTPVEITEGPHNIFADGHPVTGEEDFDYEAEVARRSPNEPYVITHEEFMTNENDWEQHSVVYFNGDDTLVDEQDMPIPDIEVMIGSENLERFGDGSKDPRIVYIRNEAKEMDFEVRLDDNSFGEQTAGFIKHSAPRRRFRSDDDE